MSNYKALYRVFRPKTFAEVVGQDAIVTILQNQIKNNQISHAYLFTGTRGTGKTSVAKIFARAISCPNSKDGEPCGSCTLCQDSLQDTSVDIIEIDAASNNGVDEIRDLRDKVKFSPVNGNYKVYIIDEVHMLSTGAFNALLKTLEEPPEHAVFILATTEPHKLPDTVISRCQRYDFNRIPTPVMVAQLQKIAEEMKVETEPAALNLIASHSEGGLRDAISLLDQCIVFGENKVTENAVRGLLGISNQSEMFQLATAILNYDSPAAITQIETLVKEGKDVSILAGDIITHFRGLLVYQMTQNPTEILSPYYEQDYRAQSQAFPLERILEVIDKLSHTQLSMRYATIPMVFLELALLQLTTPPQEAAQKTAAAPRQSNAAPPAQTPVEAESQQTRPKTTPRETPSPAQTPPLTPPKESAPPEEIAPPAAPPKNATPSEVAAPPAAPPKNAVPPPETPPEEEQPISSPRVEQLAHPAEVTREVYDQLLQHIRKANKSLFTMMRQGFYDGYADGKLTIGFPGEECEVFMQAVEKRKEEISKFLDELGFSAVRIGVTMSKIDNIKEAEALFGKENIKIIE